MNNKGAKIDQKVDLIWAIADKLTVLYEKLRKPKVFDPNSGVIEEATPETYVEDTYIIP